MALENHFYFHIVVPMVSPSPSRHRSSSSRSSHLCTISFTSLHPSIVTRLVCAFLLHSFLIISLYIYVVVFHFPLVIRIDDIVVSVVRLVFLVVGRLIVLHVQG
ncbi:uncharacterized protein LOC127107670 isoform X2 [Lathyrus oleraceus]|uniref:uncharacterized protein LOC127107670 isoform X2 n=1 Tax=Pisum sativum TaxID=3888 RepID=UPI0021D3E485|nr:uncharacterized protein LOC127107670 isoform X2 [Pisum sativum]